MWFVLPLSEVVLTIFFFTVHFFDCMLQKCFQFRLDFVFPESQWVLKNALSFSEKKKKVKCSFIYFKRKFTGKQIISTLIHYQILSIINFYIANPFHFKFYHYYFYKHFIHIYIEITPSRIKHPYNAKSPYISAEQKKKFPRQFSFDFLQASSPSVAFKFGTCVFIAHIFGLIAWWLQPWTFS